MMKQRLFSAVLSLSVLGQMTAGMLPELPAAAAGQNSLSLSEFAAQVRETLKSDDNKTFYKEIVYDPAAGTLTPDGGAAQTEIGALSVRGGELLVDTGVPKRKGISVQAVDRYAQFDAAAEAMGYESEQRDGVQIITNEFQTARLIVKAAGRIDSYGAVRVAEGWNDLHILQYADSTAAYAAYQRYSADSSISYVQPSHRVIMDTDTCDAETSDVSNHQYNTWGADLIGTEDFIDTYLNAELLPEVVVAVIDTGINPTPSLFQGRIVEGGINVSDTGDDTVNDDKDHGTHVSGTICELTPSNVKILPVKVFDADGTASDEQIYIGMMFALEQNADVLNMSFGGLGVSPLEVEAMHIADEAGVICCAAAGNKDDKAEYYYPGGIASCITVAAVDSNMQRASFSNYGALVDVTAPGVGVESYVLGDQEQKEKKNGTSMATPHVAACCALLRSYDKTITPRRAEALLQRNATDIGTPGFDDDFGWGLVCMKDFQWDDGICYAPEFSGKSGNYGTPQTIELTSLTEGAEILYTTDGSLPTAENGIKYTAPLTITETTYLRAITVKDGFAQSVPSEAVYMIGGLDTANAWKIADGTVVRYRGVRSSVQIPAAPDGKPVTRIAADAFRGNHFVTEVVLPETVTEIGDEAFAECAKLSSVTAKNAAVIGTRAFADDPQLQTAVLAETWESVGNAAFSGCASLRTMTLNGITEIPAECFANCSAMVRVTAKDARIIGARAFSGCKTMRTAELCWTKVTAIGTAAFEKCAGWTGDLCLSSLETLGSGAFSGDSALQRVTLPAQISVLPEMTFYGCSGLRMLQLPGVTKLEPRALALMNTRSGFLAELNYAGITSVGAQAFYGFLLGDGRDTVCFSSLETAEEGSFAGASAGGISLPKLKTVPKDLFANAKVGFAELPQAETLEECSLTGVYAAVLTAAAQEIAPTAFSDSAWVVSLDELPLPETITENRRCAEPLVLDHCSNAVTAAQHTAAPLWVLACGIDLQYQWYQMSGDVPVALNGETSACLYADTAEPGQTAYRCIMTDAGGKTEQIDVTLTVTAENAAPSEMTADTALYVNETKEQRFAVTVPASGTWTLRAFGSVPVQGLLTDAAGKPAARLHTAEDGVSSCIADLSAGECYYLVTSAVLDGIYQLMLTQTAAAQQQIADCTVQAETADTTPFGKEFHPVLRVTAPDGSLLKEDRDYSVYVSSHNQQRTLLLFGAGAYSGCTSVNVTAYTSLAADTPLPISLSDSGDRAVCVFVPKETAEYYFYATYGAGYAEEQKTYSRLGKYPNGSRYVAISTRCVVSNTPDGSGTVFADNNYSAATGNFFCSTVKLNAGQTYYFICSAESAAEYHLVISETLHSLEDAEVQGVYYGQYGDGISYNPKVKVWLDGKLLQEGVDYQRFSTNNDVPGKATVSVVGMGLYTGRIDKRCDILYLELMCPWEDTPLNTPKQITCNDERMEIFSFTVTDADDSEDSEGAYYRILNERLTGGKILFRLYRYDARSYSYTLMHPAAGTTADYELKNGTYCVFCFRQYAEQKSVARFTVLKPYSLADADVTIGNTPYIGCETEVPLTVTAPDGTLLERDKDYTVYYPSGHTLFGEVQFLLRPTNTSYGVRLETFMIELVLQEDAPILETGAHSQYLTYDDRLAIYRVTAEEDTEYTLASEDAPDIVLRVFTPEGKMLDQTHGYGARSLSFTVPAGETRYVMLKFNDTGRQGTLHFRLETSLRLLSNCEYEAQTYVATGERITPDVVFRDGDYVLKEGVDYRLRYTSDDINIGTATANYVGMGRYFGFCDVTYYIVAENLFDIPDMESFPVQIAKGYEPVEETECPYLIYRYTAGTAMELRMLIMEARCTLTVQRYRTDGSFDDSILVFSAGTQEFEMQAGETCYFLFSKTDISTWNQTFRFMLEDKNANQYTLVTDSENGVEYRCNPETGYAEVFALDGEKQNIRLLPALTAPAMPVAHVPEALFRDLPADTVVFGYAGCAAAEYADRYHFTYIESTEATEEAGDLNGDHRCSSADLVLLMRMIGEGSSMEVLSAAQWEKADCNGDGMMDLNDFLVLSALIASAGQG